MTCRNGRLCSIRDPHPPSFHDDRLRAYPIGQVYEVITQGIRNMPSYAAQVPVEDRWAIATYLRTLQVAGAAGIEQVPPDVRQAHGWAPARPTLPGQPATPAQPAPEAPAPSGEQETPR